MSIANPTTCDAPDRHAAQTASVIRPAAGPWQAREDGEDYIPDAPQDEDYASAPDPSEAAYAHIEGLREAMGLLDDAENLLAVLMASIGDEGDSRAMQAEAVLKVVSKKLRKAHTRIDRQESRHRKLFVAYFELKTRSEDEAD